MCDSCEVLNINGMNCHETGCPDAWKDYNRDCKWCGMEFKPEEQDQWFCDDSCAASYHGWDYFEDDQPISDQHPEFIV